MARGARSRRAARGPTGPRAKPSVSQQAPSAATTSTQCAQLPVEAISLIASDLPRLPDVQQLISDHAHKLESLRDNMMSMIHPSHLYDVARDKLAKLPDVQQFFLEHVEHFPEWQASLEAHLPESMPLPSFEWKDGIPSAVSDALERLGTPRWIHFPPALADKFQGLPSAKKMMGLSLTTFDSWSFDSLRAAGAPLASMPDLHNLLARHWDRLPHLQELVESHYGEHKKPDLKHYKYLPSWMQDNHHVHTGYRPEMLSFRRCLYSLVYVHNESVNIYSHLIGGLVFLLCAMIGLLCVDRHWADHILMCTFHAGALTCLLGSAMFHLFFCHSEQWGQWFQKLDYAGITAMIGGSTITVEYFAFFCRPGWLATYVTMTAAFSALCLYLTFSERYSSKAMRQVRVLTFIALAATGVVPVVHLTQAYGLDHVARVIDYFWIGAVSAPSYLLGALVYVTRFPECFLPGKFDIWCHSHQLWHMFVFAGALTHYFGVLNMLNYRTENGCAFEDSF
eukprot:m.99670 g.99670  ORF g.99670 m.99670 type:complete len:508 (-) comp15349_c0_seq4:192-1715(-)